jgi:hypothetical protein
MKSVALVFTSSAPVALPARPAYDPRPREAGMSGRTVEAVGRLASIVALGLSVALPLVVLLEFAAVPPDSRRFPEALIATGLYLPLHVRHVRYGLRGVRPRGLPWTLLAMTGVIVGFTPVLGPLAVRLSGAGRVRAAHNPAARLVPGGGVHPRGGRDLGRPSRP